MHCPECKTKLELSELRREYAEWLLNQPRNSEELNYFSFDCPNCYRGLTIMVEDPKFSIGKE